MNIYEYFDTHAHLDVKDFDEDREALIKQLQTEKIGVITIGTDKKSSFEAVALANQFENVFATIGYHPTDAKEEFREEDFLELVKNPKVVGVGECGLEFLIKRGINAELTQIDAEEKERQIKLFKKQINFAVKYGLPVVVHCRDAHKEVIEILEAKKLEYGDKLKGVIHFFSGGIEETQKYLDLGFYFSFGGVLTFTDTYNKVLKFIPIERILSETDAPFVAPVPYRGKRNSSLYIKEIVEKIAEIKQTDLVKTKEILVKNTTRIFSLNLGDKTDKD